MPATVSITFLQDLNTWDGLFRKGETLNECPVAKAQQWADEGLVSIGAQKASAAPAPEKTETLNTPNNATRANRPR